MVTFSKVFKKFLSCSRLLTMVGENLSVKYMRQASSIVCFKHHLSGFESDFSHSEDKNSYILYISCYKIYICWWNICISCRSMYSCCDMYIHINVCLLEKAGIASTHPHQEEWIWQ